MDNHRLLCVHADPASATPDEIRDMASTVHEYRRRSGQPSLLDQFAMAALTGIAARGEADSRRQAQYAYDIGRAMLAERERQNRCSR
jgi:hypothetical protein